MSIPESLKQQCENCGGTGSVQFYPIHAEKAVRGTIVQVTLASSSGQDVNCVTCGGSGYTLPSQEEMNEYSFRAAEPEGK